MRYFQQLIVFLFALFAFALAQESGSDYDATVYVTSTVYRVNTVTMSGASPTGVVSNSTSTIPAVIPHVSGSPIYSAGNGTMATPTGSYGSSPSAPGEFTGAASTLSMNGLVAVIAAGVAYLAL